MANSSELDIPPDSDRCDPTGRLTSNRVRSTLGRDLRLENRQRPTAFFADNGRRIFLITIHVVCQKQVGSSQNQRRWLTLSVS